MGTSKIVNTQKEKLGRLEQSRLAKECAKLDPDFEKALAEERLSGEYLERYDNPGKDIYANNCSKGAI